MSGGIKEWIVGRSVLAGAEFFTWRILIGRKRKKFTWCCSLQGPVFKRSGEPQGQQISFKREDFIFGLCTGFYRGQVVVRPGHLFTVDHAASVCPQNEGMAVAFPGSCQLPDKAFCKRSLNLGVFGDSLEIGVSIVILAFSIEAQTGLCAGFRIESRKIAVFFRKIGQIQTIQRCSNGRKSFSWSV